MTFFNISYPHNLQIPCCGFVDEEDKENNWSIRKHCTQRANVNVINELMKNIYLCHRCAKLKYPEYKNV